jgi:hypothetical protein
MFKIFKIFTYNFNLAIFVSGGMDGNVILWEISNYKEDKNLIMEKFFEFNLI